MAGSKFIGVPSAGEKRGAPGEDGPWVRSLSATLRLERVERLRIIPAVAPITGLTRALEVGDVQRFSSIKKATSYRGLCGAENTAANIIKRIPLSKQRNKNPQTILIEAAKMAPRNSPELAMDRKRRNKKTVPTA